jgi:hypothetical protein
VKLIIEIDLAAFFVGFGKAADIRNNLADVIENLSRDVRDNPAATLKDTTMRWSIRQCGFDVGTARLED